MLALIFALMANRKETKNNGTKYLSKATYGCIQNALCHMYQLKNIQFPDDFYSNLSKMMSTNIYFIMQIFYRTAR